MEQMYKKIGECTSDNLIAGHEVPILVKGITLAKGQGIIKRGTVLGLVTATGLAKPVNSAMADGTEVANCIITDTVDTGTTVDVVTTAYTTGIFNKNALIFGGTDTLATHENKLISIGFHLRENLAY